MYLCTIQYNISATNSKFGVRKLSTDTSLGYPRFFIFSVKSNHCNRQQRNVLSIWHSIQSQKWLRTFEISKRHVEVWGTQFQMHGWSGSKFGLDSNLLEHPSTMSLLTLLAVFVACLLFVSHPSFRLSKWMAPYCLQLLELIAGVTQRFLRLWRVTPKTWILNPRMSDLLTATTLTTRCNQRNLQDGGLDLSPKFNSRV